jgi:hypothetical protein
LADSIVILVVAGRAGTAVDLGLVNSIEWARSAGTLKHELAAAAGKYACSAGILRVSSCAYALSAGYNLISSAGEAVSIGIEDLITLALANALVSGDDLTGWAIA